MTPRQPVRTGLDRLITDPERLRDLAQRRIGLLVNPTSVTRDFVHAIDAFVAAGIRPVRLFGPEHGVRGEAQDMIAVGAQRDPLTGIPVVSLYGSTFESLRPSPEALDGLDLVVIDLQDVGSRYYTYVYTAWMTALACVDAGVDVLVLDRPNPIAAGIEGPTVSAGFESFVGMLPLPNRHGLSLAEVLRFGGVRFGGSSARALGQGATGERSEGGVATVEVITVQGWQRSLWFDQHDAPWVLPSPNMPTLDTATVYPGMCLLEGTNASEGRGTTRPFEIFGAPYVDAHRLAETLGALRLPGVAFRPLSFEPTFQKWARTRCSGLQLHVTERDAFDSFLTGAAVVWALRRTCGAEFGWREQAYEFVEDVPAIDLLFGSDAPRQAIDGGCTFDELRALLATPAELSERVHAARLLDYG